MQYVHWLKIIACPCVLIMVFSFSFFHPSFSYFCPYSSATLSLSHGVPLHMLLSFTHDLSPMHMPHCYLVSLPAGTCWRAIWASSIPCFSELVLPDGGCQQGPDPVVPLQSVVAFVYPCILIEIQFLMLVSVRLPGCLQQSRHRSEEQLTCLIGFS